MVQGDAYSIEAEIINECGLPELVPAEYGGTADITKE